MATQQLSDDGDPRVELSRAHGLAHRVRRSQRASWFPLFVFAILTFAAVPISRSGHPSITACRAVPDAGLDARVCLVHNSAAFIYWPIALVLAYVAIATFYLRHSRARGVGSRVRAYVIVGLALAVAVTVASVWAAHRPPLVGQQDVLGLHIQGRGLYGLVAPACAIGLALLVLAAVERSVALLVVTLIYLAVALVPIDFGWTIAFPSRWNFLPHLIIQGSVLIVAAIGFAAAQRPGRRDAA